MINNEVSAVMEQETYDKIMLMIDELTALFPSLITLSVKERKKCHKKGDRSYSFVENAYSIGKEFNELVPSFVDMDEMRKDLDYEDKLSSIESKLRTLSSQLSDTRLKAGSEAMRAAVSIYNSVKLAQKNNVSGSRTAYELLKPRFAVSRRPKNKPQEPEKE